MNFGKLENLVGFLAILIGLAFGAYLSFMYIMEDPERQRGAGALAVCILLVATAAYCVVKDRQQRQQRRIAE